MSQKIGTKPLILVSKIVSFEIWNEDPRDGNTDDATDGRDDESPFLAQVVLDGGESFGADGGPLQELAGFCPRFMLAQSTENTITYRFSYRSRYTIASASNGSGIAL